MAADTSEEILAFLDTYFSSYEKLEFDTCRSLWDSQHPNLSWKPTEAPHAITTFEEISAYMEGTHFIDLQAFRPARVYMIDFIRDDVAFVLADMVCKFFVPRSDALTAAYDAGTFPFIPGETSMWQGLSTFVLHKRNDQWKLIHYEDSTQWNCVNNAEEKDFA